MLPVEVLTLVFLFSVATATPQLQQPTGANFSLKSDSSASSTFLSSGTPLLIHDETTATGWETTATPKAHTETHQSTWESSYLPPTNVPPSTFTSAAAIRTEIRASITKLEPETEPTAPGDGGYGSSGGGGGGVAQSSSEGDLLGNIISRITETRGQPTNQPASPTENALSPDGQPTVPGGGYTGQPQLTENSLALPVVQATTGAGLSITVGPATLTLTPGLSTTIGSGFSATLVEMTTDSEGHTVVIVSSSGVATTATLSETPATASVPRSASITPEATSGGIRGTSSSVPTSTHSTGGGMHWESRNVFTWMIVCAGLGVIL